MGEVYRSRDSKLGREVALKVLPSTLAGDSDRLGRFSREAKVLAALNHPNIAAIYGLEDFGATHALVIRCFVSGYFSMAHSRTISMSGSFIDSRTLAK